jgi:glucose/arabinose dehydrogenase
VLHSLTGRLVALVALCGLVTSACGQPPSPTPSATPKPNVEGRGNRVDRVNIDTFVQGVQLPAALTFAPDGRLFFVEVNAGRVRVAENGVLQERPVATFPVQQASESGLLGLALDPSFETNHHVYVYYSEGDAAQPGRGLRNRVVRFVERKGEASDITPILDNLPVSESGMEDAHQGGALVFGPDGKLYVSVGDTGRSDLAQDLNATSGKVLRINADGSVPSDNPFPGSPVYALGFRNPWGMAVSPRTGGIYVSNNGNKSHDTIVLLQPRANYGWPLFEGGTDDPKFTSPVWDSGDGADSRNGITALALYEGAMFPEYRDSLFFCAFRTGKLRRLTLGGPDQDRVDAQQRLDAECRLGLAIGADGAIYTSSIDKILRLSA